MSDRRRFLMVGLLLTGGLALACSSETGFQSPSEYFPLRAGLRWEYDMSWAFAFVGAGSGKMVNRISGSEQIGEHRYYRFVTTYAGLPGAEDETNYYRLTNQGLYAIRGNHRESGEFLALPFPAEQSMSWNVRAAGLDLAYTVEAIETVELATGSFPNSLKLRFSGSVDGERVEGYEQYAPGVGLIRGMQKYSGGAIDYSFKKPND